MKVFEVSFYAKKYYLQKSGVPSPHRWLFDTCFAGVVFWRAISAPPDSEFANFWFKFLPNCIFASPANFFFKFGKGRNLGYNRLGKFGKCAVQYRFKFCEGLHYFVFSLASARVLGFTGHKLYCKEIENEWNLNWYFFRPRAHFSVLPFLWDKCWFFFFFFLCLFVLFFFLLCVFSV